MSDPEPCIEPIGYTSDPNTKTQGVEGYYYCRLPKDHKGAHLIFVPSEPEYWQSIKDEENEEEETDSGA